MRDRRIAAAFICGLVACPLGADAAITVQSDAFIAVTDGAITTTGTSDWGYVVFSGGSSGLFDSNLGGAGLSYNDTPFGSVQNNAGTNITVVSGSPTIGQVTLTEGTAGTNTVDPQSNATGYTFDGAPASGSYGNFAPTEQDVWRMTFKDLGVGEHTITLYLGHTNTNRSFDMDIAGPGVPANTTTTSGALSTFGSTTTAGTGLAFAYEIVVTVDDPADDLSLTHGGIGGSAGGAFLAGYTVVTVPEPSAVALLGLAGLALFRRRR